VNYLLHGLEALGEPYVVAGTAVPDWLRVVGRRVEPSFAVQAGEPLPLAGISRGVELHFRADRRFHSAPEFQATCRRVSARLRSEWPQDPRFRASFYAHILVEILLDAEVIARNPETLDRYYESLESVDDVLLVAWAAGRAIEGGADLARIARRFIDERFLATYDEDEGVAQAVARVGRRARLPDLPKTFARLVSAIRRDVSEHSDELFRCAGVRVESLRAGS